MDLHLLRVDLRAIAALGTVLGVASAHLAHIEAAEPPAPVPVVVEAAADTVPRADAPARTPVALQAARAVLEGFGIESGVENMRVSNALDALSPHVTRQSDPAALQSALQAYYNYRAKHPEKVRKPYLYFVDFGLDARTPRGWVFDMDAMTVVEGPFTVAHGRGSAPTASGIPTRFSNVRGSNATSLGLYLAQETYGFSGRSGGRPYRSVGLRLAGVSGSHNSAARTRGIVVHGAPYVTPSFAGRSEGCPAMEQARAQRLLPRIANGGMVFHFSPRDRRWMEDDPWINGA
jgi:hypothetical protein